MKIGIYNLEPKYINIALEKIKMFHESKGDLVEPYFALGHNTYDKIYASSLFDFTDKRYITDDMEIGGTGFIDLIKKELPAEIEAMKPKINIGFTSRGCIRKCPFCLVPEKEGMIRAVGDIYDFWDGKSKELIILDNNILALPEHFEHICDQIKSAGIKVDFNQGLDLRLLTGYFINILQKIRHTEYKFAWDNTDDLTDKLKTAYDKFGRCLVYVFCDGDWDWEYEKICKIKEIGHNAYVMRSNKVRKDKKYIQLARWVNQHNCFQRMTFEEFKVA